MNVVKEIEVEKGVAYTDCAGTTMVYSVLIDVEMFLMGNVVMGTVEEKIVSEGVVKAK